MSDFLVGFEFEFGWLPSSFVSKKPSSKPHYFENHILPEVEVSISKSFPHDILDIKEDCTLKFNQNLKYWHTYYGVEVVSMPLPEKEALDFLSRFISWLNEQPNIQINQTCSLHLNINFKDSKLNHKIDYWKLLDDFPQEKILTLFNRQKNEYCKNSKKIKISYEEFCCLSKERTLDYWKNKIQSWKNKENIYLKMIKKSFGSERYEISKQTKKIIKLRKNIEEMLPIIQENFQERILSMNKNLSIVKKNESNPYYEFRMIGNKNYHRREKDILLTLNLCKKYIYQSLIN